MRFNLVDQDQREIARSRLDQSLAVEAGAGTGKTTLLVDRILSLIRQGGARFEEIAAITFTEKAAGELKIRVREVLEEAIPKARGEEAETLIQALSDLEKAQISTIHSFCAGLLRERPVEAGVDPNFEPLDELGLDMLFQEFWDHWLKQETEKRTPALRRALALGMNLEELARLVRQIYENRDLIPVDPFPRSPYGLDSFIHQLQQDMEKAGRLAEDCRVEEDRGFQSIRLLTRKVQELTDASPERKEIILLRELFLKPQGNKQNWKSSASCEAQKELMARLARELETIQSAIRADVVADLIDWLKHFLAEFQGGKNERGVLDFQDLLLFARDLLQKNREVRRYFQEKFRYLLVDEFQDTDPLQVEVVFFLAEAGAVAEKWEEVKVAPGRLFLVGDPKQSIYRFRRADIEIYNRATRKLEIEGGNLRIVQNFRTVPSIISWVNRLFETLIRPSAEGDYQPAYIPLEAHPQRRETAEGRPGIILLPPADDFIREEVLAHGAREAEGRSIAALIEEMAAERSSGPWTIFDKRIGRERPIHLGDIALLFPTMTGIEAYEEALRARGIPYRLEGGREFYLRQEVRSLLCCLKALDDPADEVSLVAALRSPFFGFSDEEIFLWVSSGNALNYLRSPSEGWKEWEDSFSLLRRLHEERNSFSISHTVAELLARTKALEFSLLRPGGEQTAANLRKILNQARAWTGEQEGTFRRFVQWLEMQEEEGVREGESPWTEEGEENLKLLTVHKAKGLEFPVVFLANLAGTRNRRQEFVPLRLQGTFELAIGPFKTSGFDSALQQEQARMEAEDLRLLYVAATRARDYLVLPLFWGKRNKGFFNFLEGHLPVLGGVKPWSLVDGQLIARGFNLEQPEKPPLRLDLMEKNADQATPLLRRSKWKEALDSAREKASRGLSLLAPSSSAEEGWEKPLSGPGGGAGGARLGLAFHGIMEHLDLLQGENLKELCAMETRMQSLEERAQEIESLCLNCLNHPVMDRVRGSKRFYREVPFTVSAESQIVEGKIDLLFQEEDGWVVVDYKTDEVRGKALEERFQSYLEQGRWYARAVAQAASVPVKEVIFFFVRTGETRSIPQ